MLLYLKRLGYQEQEQEPPISRGIIGTNHLKSIPWFRSSNVDGGEEITVVPDMPGMEDSFDNSRDNEDQEEEEGEGEAQQMKVEDIEMETDRESFKKSEFSVNSKVVSIKGDCSRIF